MTVSEIKLRLEELKVALDQYHREDGDSQTNINIIFNGLDSLIQILLNSNIATTTYSADTLLRR